jgi:hypothetical protein
MVDSRLLHLRDRAIFSECLLFLALFNDVLSVCEPLLECSLLSLRLRYYLVDASLSERFTEHVSLAHDVALLRRNMRFGEVGAILAINQAVGVF